MADVVEGSEVTFGSPTVGFEVGGFAAKPYFPRYYVVVTTMSMSEPLTQADADKLANRTQNSVVSRIDGAGACQAQNRLSTR
jgi:hypothetical protein